MSAIVYKEIQNREYFLGVFPNHQIEYDEYFPKMNIGGFNSKYIEEEGEVLFRDEHKEWIEIAKTDNFIREFKVGERININNENLFILKKSHNLDGDILYYTDKVEIIKDNESKKQAEEDLIKRKNVLLERKKSYLDAREKYALDESKMTIKEFYNQKLDKKWYQFWK